MKKVFFMLLAVIAFCGCSNEDEPNHAEAIYGKWVQVSYKSSTGGFIGQEDGTYIQFNQNGTFEFFYSGLGVFNETTRGTYKTPTSFVIELLKEDGTTAEITINQIEGNKATFHFLYLHNGTYKFERK